MLAIPPKSRYEKSYEKIFLYFREIMDEVKEHYQSISDGYEISYDMQILIDIVNRMYVRYNSGVRLSEPEIYVVEDSGWIYFTDCLLSEDRRTPSYHILAAFYLSTMNKKENIVQQLIKNQVVEYFFDVEH